MGTGLSTDLKKPFNDIIKWPKTRIEASIQNFKEGEYDFGLDAHLIMTITGVEPEEAQILVQALSRNENGVVNALTLLISLILLGNSDVKSDWQRAEQIFDLFDFNQSGRLNIDEVTILVLCVGTALNFILNKESEDETVIKSKENSLIKFTKNLFEYLNNVHKKGTNGSGSNTSNNAAGPPPNTTGYSVSSSLMSRDDFLKILKEKIFEINGIQNIEDLNRVLFASYYNEVDNGSNKGRLSLFHLDKYESNCKL